MMHADARALSAAAYAPYNAKAEASETPAYKAEVKIRHPRPWVHACVILWKHVMTQQIALDGKKSATGLNLETNVSRAPQSNTIAVRPIRLCKGGVELCCYSHHVMEG